MVEGTRFGPQAESAEPAKSGRGRRILVVSRDSVTRDLLAVLCKKNGFLVDEAETASDAKRLLDAGVGTFIIVSGWTMAACVLAAGRMLARRRRYLFCLVMAGIECLMMPLGTILGVFTIIVLSRESVKAAFEANVTADSGFPAPPQFHG